MIKPVTTWQEAADLLSRTNFNKELSKHILDNLDLDFMTRMLHREPSFAERILDCANVTRQQVLTAKEPELNVSLLVVNFAEWWKLDAPRGRFRYRDLLTEIVKGHQKYLDFVLFEKESDGTVKRTIVL